MKKHFKKLVSLVLVLAMVLSMSSVAFAKPGRGSSSHGSSSRYGWSSYWNGWGQSSQTDTSATEETVTEEATVEEPAAEEAVVEETTEEAAPVEETVEEATPVEETVEEAAPAEETVEVAPEVSYPAAEFNSKDVKGVEVNVVAPEGAFPEGTTMSVKEVTDEDILAAVAGAADGNIVKAVDISFYDGTREIEPKKEIRVTMTADEVAEVTDPVIVHVDDEMNAEVVEQADDIETADNEVVFDSANFSVYAIVESDSTGSFDYDQIIDGNRIRIKAPEGAFESGTEMKIEKVSDPDILVKALAALDDDKTYSISAIDISFWKDGIEVEPALPVEVTWESADISKTESEIVHIEDDGTAEKITNAEITNKKAVFTAESFSTYTTTRQDTISLENMSGKITFNPSTLTPKTFNSGTIASTHPEYDGYTFRNATLIKNGIEDTSDPIVYIGAFLYQDDTDTDGTVYIYYRTESTSEDSDLIVRLVENETIKLNYDSTPLTVTYRVVYNGTTYTLGDGCSLPEGLKSALGSDADALIINGPSSVAERTTYDRAITVDIPRGYSATGTIVSSAMNPALGVEPTYSVSSDNKIITKSGELELSGVYDFPSTTSSNPVVTINLTKRNSFKFDASKFLSTVYTGGSGTNTMGDSSVNTNTNARVTGDGSLGRSGSSKGTKTFNADSVSWSFTTNNTESSTWLMDALEINGTTIEVPYANTNSDCPVSKTTTLPSGTVVTVTLTGITGSARANIKRSYTISVNNCYEDIVISGGNIFNSNNSTEIITEVLDNVSYQFYGYRSSDLAAARSGLGWQDWGVGEPIAVNQGVYSMYTLNNSSSGMRFKVTPGYVNPQIAYVTSTGSDLKSYISGLTLGTKSGDYYPVTSNAASDGYYNFYLTGMGNNNSLALLRIKAELARYGVNYESGTVTGATIPEYDWGGYYDDAKEQLQGYNVVDNDYIVLDKSSPVDPSKEYIFLYYTIKGDSSNTQYAPSQKIALEDVAKYGVFDSEKGEYVIPFVANWDKAKDVNKITVSVDIYLDDERAETVSTNVPENSAIYIDIDSETMSDFMDKYNWQLFYDEMDSEPFINNVTAENSEVELRLYSKFYVYHSSTGNLTLHTTKELETGTGDNRTIAGSTLDITNLVSSGYYYGGYFKDYIGAHEGQTASGKNLVKAAADDNNENGTLTTDDIRTLSNGGAVTIAEGVGTAYDPVNNEAHLSYWTRTNAFTTALKNSDTAWFSDRGKDTAILRTGGNGKTVQVARACIYYLNEVPADYLAAPNVVTIKENYGKGDISAMTILSVTDTSIYRTGGEYIDGTAKRGSFATNFTLTKQDAGTNESSTVRTETAKSLYSIYGRLTVTDGSTCMSSGNHTLIPYWITYDNVTVKGTDVVDGHTKTITVNGNTVTTAE